MCPQPPFSQAQGVLVALGPARGGSSCGGRSARSARNAAPLLGASSVSSVSLGTGSDSLIRGSCQGCGAVGSHGCREMFPAVGMGDVSDSFSVPLFPFPHLATGSSQVEPQGEVVFPASNGYNSTAMPADSKGCTCWD